MGSPAAAAGQVWSKTIFRNETQSIQNQLEFSASISGKGVDVTVCNVHKDSKLPFSVLPKLTFNNTER